MPKTKCLECRGDVKEKEREGSIKCSQCDRWSHTGCTTLSPELVKELWAIYDASGRHFWACEGCTSAFSNMSKRMLMFEKEMAEMKLAVNKNTQDVKDVNEKVDKVTESFNEDKKKRKKDNFDLISEATKRMSAELRERENRKNNLVLYGLCEPQHSVKGRDRKDEDLEVVGDLFKAMDAKVNSTRDIKFSYRLGQLTDAVYEDPRPLCIGLITSETRDQVLKKAKNLGKTRNFFKVSITPDLTVQQRAEDKALVKEAEEKNRNMNDEDQGNWIYRCIGLKGQRTIARLRVQDGQDHPRGGQHHRGGRRPQPQETPINNTQDIHSGGQWPRQPRLSQETPYTGANSIPLLHRRTTLDPPPPGVGSDSEEEFNGYPTINQGARQKRTASASPSVSPNSYPPRQNQNKRMRGRPSNLRFGAANL